MIQTLAQTAAAPPAASPQAIPAWGLWVMALVGLAFMVVSIVRNSRKVVRSGEDPPASEPQRHWLARRKPAKPSDGKLAAAANDLLAQLDQRAATLERLIALADDRIAAMQRVQPASAAASRSSTSELKPGSDPSTHSSRTSQVYRLADEGHTPQQIAQATGVAIGEVNLVLALRN